MSKIRLSLYEALQARQVCGTSRIPNFLDNRLTDGGEVVILKRRPPLTPRKIPDTPIMRLEGLGQSKKSSDFIGM
jgi:hypothetical protein